MTPRAELRRFADVIQLWTRGFDTARIAAELRLPEPVVERFVWSFRDAARAA